MLVAVALVPAQRLRILGKQAAADFVSRLQSRHRHTDLLHGFLALALHQGLAQQVQLVFRLGGLGGGQEHFGFDQHQVGRHGDEFTGNFHVHPLHFFQICQVLLQNGGDGHILNFNFIFTQQFKNNVQRAFKILQRLSLGMDDAL